MSSPRGIVAQPPEKHNLCGVCTGKVQFVGYGCCVHHCPMCQGALFFSTRMCLKCSTDKGLCQGCGESLTREVLPQSKPEPVVTAPENESK